MNQVTPGKDNTFFIFSWLFALVLGETIETVFKSNRSLHVQFAMRTLTVIKSQIRINRTFQFCFPVPIAFSFPFLSFVPDIIWILFLSDFCINNIFPLISLCLCAIFYLKVTTFLMQVWGERYD